MVASVCLGGCGQRKGWRREVYLRGRVAENLHQINVFNQEREKKKK